MCLVTEGKVKASDSPATMVTKVVACVGEDAAAVAAEIAAAVVHQGMQRFGSFLKDKIDGLARDLAEGGFSKFWERVMVDYERGADVTRRK